VTGGAQRIGRAIAVALAQRGYAVAVQTRQSGDAAAALVAGIVAAGGRAAVVEADLADHAAVLRLVPAAAAQVGPLTLLVNNAAEFEPDEIGALDRARFDRHVAVNLRAPIFLADAFAAQAPADADGSIVNLLDQRVFKPTPRFLSYGLTKSALLAATTTLAQALAPRIRVNAVAPGPIDTEIHPPGRLERIAPAVPLGRAGTAEEVAEAVVFLLSDASSYTNGAILRVAGGR
jgi:NAD(P)-dependent dehydrogenase (short-subunit alcohol dehydrogenase family)